MPTPNTNRPVVSILTPRRTQAPTGPIDDVVSTEALLGAQFARDVGGVMNRFDEFTDIPGVGSSNPQLDVVRATAFLAEKYGISPENRSFEEMMEIARNIAELSKEIGEQLKVGDILPESRRHTGLLRNYSHYDEDIDVMSDPSAMGVGGGYSYRGKKPRFNEDGFKKWYGAWASQLGLHPDPDHPQHKYDYRAAYRDGVQPTMGPDGEYHWPSEYKALDHPNRFVNGVDTIRGR